MTSKEANISTTQEVSPQSSSSSSNNDNSSTNKTGFFPWLEDEEHKGLSLKVIRRFPILGAIGLIGSALTVLLSYLTLFFFNGHKVIDSGHMPKPAAWLSIILSLNSILIHMAVSQGIAVTWWYRASREKATVADLHNVWATGSSVVSAITSYKTFNYIALATVFVATLPINGILLQNSLSSAVNYKTINASSIDFALASSLPAGFSATLNTADGTIESYQSSFQTQIPYLVNNPNTQYRSYNVKNTCKGDCEATLAGIGFESTCTQSSIPFNLPLNNATSTNIGDVDIFSASFNWNASNPYTIGISTLYKPSTSCTGEFIVNNCTLHLGRVNYPITVSFNTSGLPNPTWDWHLNAQQLTPSHQSSTYLPSEVLSLYNSTSPSPETNETRFGGLVEALKSVFDSRIYIHPTANGTTLRSAGQFAQQLPPFSSGFNEDGTPIILSEKCNASFSSFGLYPLFGDPTSYLLDSVRTTLFYTSIFASDLESTANENSTTSIQTHTHTPITLTRNEYTVIWRWWGASVAVTLSIILFILPTFYGFWTLARSTTLSPLETARAFQAPVLREAPVTLDTKALLKKVGDKNLHTDLRVSGGVVSGEGNASSIVERGRRDQEK